MPRAVRGDQLVVDDAHERVVGAYPEGQRRESERSLEAELELDRILVHVLVTSSRLAAAGIRRGSPPTYP